MNLVWKPVSNVMLILGLFFLSGCQLTETKNGPAVEIPPNQETDSQSKLAPFLTKPIGRYETGMAYTINGKRYVPQENLSYAETGQASWYGPGLEGTLTSNGERFDPSDMTAAHRTLPFSTIVKITNLNNGQTSLARINDRGPFIEGRILDVTSSVATALGFENQATTHVKVEVDSILTRQIAQATGTSINADDNGSVLAFDSSISGNSVGGGQTYENTQVSPSLNQPIYDPNRDTSVTTTSIQTPSSPADSPYIRPSYDNSQSSIPMTGNDATFTDTGEVFIQAGSFSKKSNADALKSKLRHIGKIIIVPATVNRQQVYRVRIGPFASKQSAQSALRRVIAEGSVDAQIVQN